MKITVYTTTDCEFSKQEREYLASHSLQYEEKNLETNKDFLTEMLAISNNFAGTPVTRVEKDDGTIAVLKGFTKDEFDTTFGFSVETPAVKAETPAAETTPPVETTPTTPTPQAETPPPADEKLGSVLDKLEEKTTPTTPPMPPAPLAEESTPNATAPAPSVPDFPAK